MGGNIFKNSTRKYNSQEYHMLCHDITVLLRSTLHNTLVSVIPSYGNKRSFGDCDVLISSDRLHPQWIEILKQKFNVQNIVQNGSVVSFPFKELQIDLILAPTIEFDFSLKYFSYNDLGNLLGRVAHKMGFKFGHKGLWYIHREQDYVISEILITRNFQEALNIIGYKYLPYYEGFYTLDDIFQYVAGSIYFNPDIFLLSNRNARARVRDLKRTTYMSFLKWCEENNEHLQHYIFNDKNYYLQQLLENNATFRYNYGVSCKKYQNTIKIKSKFNGTLVAQLTGLKGKPLGQFIQKFKGQWTTNDNFSQFILNSDQNEINNLIKNSLH